MDRRLFLKLTGLVAAASALEALPVAAAPLQVAVPLTDSAASVRTHLSDGAAAPSITRLAIREPGLYQISGQVRLDAPVVEIGGIANTQTISWSGAGVDERRLASFTTFEQVTGVAPEIRVTGGQLESLTITPVIFR
jgi:hypothetical protein